MQHMVLSLSTRVRGGLSVHSLCVNSGCVRGVYFAHDMDWFWTAV